METDGIGLAYVFSFFSFPYGGRAGAKARRPDALTRQSDMIDIRLGLAIILTRTFAGTG